MALPDELRLIVFDFDGTLIDSNAIKSEGYYRTFADLPDGANAVAHVFKTLGERPRQISIAAILDFLGRPANELEDRVAGYTRFVEEAVAKAPEVKEATPLLHWCAAKVPTYISSQTPEVHLVPQVQARSWDNVVSGIFGAPRRKPDTLATLIKKHEVEPSTVLVVGDGISDEEAAQQNNTHFFRIDQLSALSRLYQQLKAGD